MKQGQKAIFIMPPHLAHGLLGDKNKVPPRATLVYDVELLNLR
jgi:FKBP-type peptidyl-prolyl cis-trans isomerase FkpA